MAARRADKRTNCSLKSANNKDNTSTDIEDCNKEEGDNRADGSMMEDRNDQGQVSFVEENLETFLAVGEDLQIKGLMQNGGIVPPLPKQPRALKRQSIKSSPSENVFSSTPAMKKVRGLSPDLDQCGIKVINSHSEVGPSVAASQAENRTDPLSSADNENNEVTVIEDCSMEGGDNGADFTIMEDRNDQWFNLPDGWRKQIFTRKSGTFAGQRSVYVWPPFGKKLRSNKDILQWVHDNPQQPINPMVVNTSIPINASGEVKFNSKIQEYMSLVQETKFEVVDKA